MTIIKSHPEDFFVKEILDLEISSGPYSYYLLKKKNVNLFFVLEVISERWKVSRERIGYCGIKDKRAITEQYISIKDGPERNLKGKNFELIFVGKGKKPLMIGDAKGNLFRTTLRNICPDRILRSLDIIGKIGFANYFGEQRFISDFHPLKPIGKLLLEGKFDEALKEYFFHHPSAAVRRKVKKMWGRTYEIAENIPGLSKMDKVVLKRFAKKKDAEYALRAYPKSIKLMFFFSYQSMIWNRILGELIKRRAETFNVKLKGGEKIFFYKSLTQGIKEILNLELPFLSEELRSMPQGEVKERILSWVKKENLEKYFDKEVLGLKPFSKGKRRVIVFPQQIMVCETKNNIVTIEFFLPKGSYATIFLLKLLNYPV